MRNHGDRRRRHSFFWLFVVVVLLASSSTRTTVGAFAFLQPSIVGKTARSPIQQRNPQQQQHLLRELRMSTTNDDDSSSDDSLLYAGIGDIVLYYNEVGGISTSVGKITYVSRQKKKISQSITWMIEIMELKNVGDGYYVEYGMYEQKTKSGILRNLKDISPIDATFVPEEYSYKVNMIDDDEKSPAILAEQYEIDTYEGPEQVKKKEIDMKIVEDDMESYNELKVALVTQTSFVAALGLGFIAITNKGDPIAFSLGSVAGILYLLFLYAKTDTMGTEDEGTGDNISIFRFFVPPIAFAVITFYNGIKMRNGEGALQLQLFSTVTPDQFIGIILGFFTYRIPLFARQVAEVFKDLEDDDVEITTTTPPRIKKTTSKKPTTPTATVLLVSGPEITDRTPLVDRLIKESKGKFIKPDTTTTSEQLRDTILTQSSDTTTIFVIDANVDAVQQLLDTEQEDEDDTIKYVGVWITLDTIQTFETRLQTQKSTANMKDIISDINYGIVQADLFDYTIVCTATTETTKNSYYDQLKTAADSCYNQNINAFQ